MRERLCDICEHRQLGNVCGLADGPFSSDEIDPDEESCPYLVVKEGPDCLQHAADLVRSAFREKRYRKQQQLLRDARELVEAAFNAGLLEDQAIFAWALLGDVKLCLCDLTNVQALEEGKQDMERAAELDARTQCGFFCDPANRERFLTKYQNVCLQRAASIHTQEGAEASAAYVDRALQLFAYLPGTHFAGLHFWLATLFHERGEHARARQYYQSTLEADVLDEPFEQQFRSWAKEALEKWTL